MTIDQIISGTKKGDRHCEKQLVQFLAPQLMTTARRYLRGGSICQDILQDTFIKIFQNLHKQDAKKGSLLGWAHRICVNECLHHIRSQKIEYTDLDTSEIDITTDPGVFSQFAIADLLHDIGQLPVQYRAVFNLIAIEGYSHEEAAKLLGISASTSRSNYSRARNNLRSALKCEMMEL